MKEYRINVDPRILELLGPNLYTNIYYVLAELIANAYDADASNVYIISNKNDIRIEDDGHGMSYSNGDIDKFLNVAGVSRTSEENSFSRSGHRRKMGRKGVGKLAALSVSENVDVMTVADGEKSGFILSRNPLEGNQLQPIPENDIKFDRVLESGTAIVMKNPQYRLHKSLNAIKRNLLKIFPMVNADFVIHIIRGNEEEKIESLDKNIAADLCSITILGDKFKGLNELVPNHFPDRRSELVEVRPIYSEPLTLKDNNGKEGEYTLEIEGWIGAYKTTKGRKAEATDFPDNFISLYANKKLGEFNILPIVGQNKLYEVYIVGQLYIDIFELSELPDMALSNRQGYKSDDLRYETVIQYVRSQLLPEASNKRSIYAAETKKKKQLKDLQTKKGDEIRLKEQIDSFVKSASEGAATRLQDTVPSSSIDFVKQAVADAINQSAPDLGLKNTVDSQKKKILISHARNDSQMADILYSMLLYNNVPADDILYTSCEFEASRIPEGVSIYDYLRDFFVDSYSTEKIFVIFVTSTNTKNAWGAMTEIGASWITQVDNKIFNISPFTPQHPLDDESVWHTTNRDAETGNLSMDKINADILCVKIEDVCDKLGYTKRERAENKHYLNSLVSII